LFARGRCPYKSLRRGRFLPGRTGDTTYSPEASCHFRLSSLQCTYRGLTMRCLLTHKWVIGKEFDFTSQTPQIAFTVPHRTCERCGQLQQGIYRRHSRSISWETMRERTYLISEHGQLVRKPLSWLDRLRHSLRMTRTRKTDLVTSVFRSLLPLE